MKDLQGREYAKLSQLKPGDLIETDQGFECMEGKKVVRLAQPEHRLYVPCNTGAHFLDGQLADEDGNSLIGVYKLGA